MKQDLRERLQDTVLRFPTAVDTLDFDLYLATFADECLYDVSSFTGTPASVVKARDGSARSSRRCAASMPRSTSVELHVHAVGRCRDGRLLRAGGALALPARRAVRR